MHGLTPFLLRGRFRNKKIDRYGGKILDSFIQYVNTYGHRKHYFCTFYIEKPLDESSFKRSCLGSFMGKNSFYSYEW